MKIYSWNVNGIRAAAKKGFLDWLNSTNPEIMCLQETKAHKEQLSRDLAELAGYHTIWHSAEKKGYSSVATFCKAKPLYEQAGLGIGKFDREGRVIITEHDNFLLYNIYFPNGQRDQERLDYKMEFYEELLKILNEQVDSGNNVVIAGDWNTAHKPIDLARPKENVKNSGFLPEERAMLDVFVEHGYVDTFRIFHDEPERYSWWTYRMGARGRNVGWRIDYFWINRSFTDNILDADIHEDVMGSDHCPVSIVIKDA